jgi:uncharacterized protein (TIGR02246 family)
MVTDKVQMRRLTLLFAHAFFFALCVPLHAQSASDESLVRAVATRWEEVWNRHDMKALAALFTEDADFVNVGARHWKGREQIEQQHAARLDQFKNSVWTTKHVSIQFLTADIAIAHIDWGLTGDTDPDGTSRPARGGVFTWVLSKHGETWLIRAAQNTNLGNLAPHAVPGGPDPLPVKPPDTSLERTREP